MFYQDIQVCLNSDTQVWYQEASYKYLLPKGVYSQSLTSIYQISNKGQLSFLLVSFIFSLTNNKYLKILYHVHLDVLCLDTIVPNQINVQI